MDDFGVVDTLLGLAQQRGEACWWEDVSRAAGAMRGENGLPSTLLEKVETVMPGIWKWSWERRDDRQQLHLRLMNGTVATEGGLEARRLAFREALLGIARPQHEAFLKAKYPDRDPSVSSSGWHPAFVVDVPLTPLPPRPNVAPLSFNFNSASRLGIGDTGVSKEVAEQVASATVPESLSHLPTHMVVEARMRGELAAANAVSDAAKMLSGFPILCESLRSLCVVNKRYVWPFVVLCTKLVPANQIHRPGVKEELRAQLEELGTITGGYVEVFDNTHADGGTYVRVGKKGFAEAMTKLTAALKSAK